jgi:hypothetical protein
MGRSKGVEATSFSEQAPARGAIISPRSDSGVGDGSGGFGARRGIVDAPGILVGQDVRDVGDVVEKFTGRPPPPPPREPGVTSRSGASSSEWGPPLHRPISEPAV